MSTNKQAPREVAEKATGAHDRLSIMPEGDIFDISLVEGTQLDEDITALNAFNDAANPDTVLALLDELEAADKRNSELSASHTNLREAMAGIHNTITGGGAYTPLASILNASKRAYEESASAAGISVKGECNGGKCE